MNKSDGPLVAVIVCLIVSVLGGYGPSLYVVRQWHLEWLWRMFPGVSIIGFGMQSKLMRFELT